MGEDEKKSDSLNPNATKWGELSSEQLPENKLREKIKTYFSQELSKEDKETLTPDRFQEIFETICQESAEADEQASEIGLSEEQIYLIYAEEILGFSRTYAEKGGLFSPAIDGIIDDIVNDDDNPQLRENNRETINALIAARITQIQEHGVEEIAHEKSQYEAEAAEIESGLDEDSRMLSNQKITAISWCADSIARRLETFKKYQELAAETGVALDLSDIYSYVSREITPMIDETKHDQHAGDYMGKLLNFYEISPDTVKGLDQATTDAIRFIESPDNNHSKTEKKFLSTFFSKHIASQKNSCPFFEEGKPTVYFQNELFLDSDTRYITQAPFDDYVKNENEINYRLCEKLLTPGQMRVLEVCKKEDVRIVDDSTNVALSEETDPELFAAKLKMHKRMEADGTFSMSGRRWIYLNAIKSPEDADRPFAEICKTPDYILAQEIQNQADVGNITAAEFPQMLRIISACVDAVPKEIMRNTVLRKKMLENLKTAFSNAGGYNTKSEEILVTNAASFGELFAAFNNIGDTTLFAEQLIKKISPIDENYRQEVKYFLTNAPKLLHTIENTRTESGRKKQIDNFASLDVIYEHEISSESAESIHQLFERVDFSNSRELQRISQEVIGQLIHSCDFIVDSDGVASFDVKDAEERLRKIEDIFLRNNIPLIAKNFVVFSTIHPKEAFEEDFMKTEGEVEVLSPTLVQGENGGIYGRYGIMLHDLLRSTLESNDINLRKYLENLRDGQAIFDQIRTGEVSADDLSDADRREVEKFIQHAATLYNQRAIGKKHPLEVNGDLTVEHLQQVQDAFHIRAGDTIANNIVRYFGYFNGLTSIEKAIGIMDHKRDAAHQRNIETARKPLIIHQGDLIKNVGGAYLDDILARGSNSKEFLGYASDSDQTPLDTDLTMVTHGETDIANCLEIQTNPNGNYGHVWFVIENTPDRFITTRKQEGEPGGDVEDAKPGDSRLELFRTIGTNEGHYGIRTGFGSEHIKAIVVELARSVENEDGTTTYMPGEYADRTCFRIVKNGYYIPVYDKETGKLLFTPEQFEEMRAQLAGCKEYATGPYMPATAEDFASDTKRIEALKSQGIIPNGEKMSSKENFDEVHKKDSAIRAAIAAKLIEGDPTLREFVEGDLTPGFIEITSTGSTGRGTNVPHDGDFDYMFRIDRETFRDETKMAALVERIHSALIFSSDSKERRGGKISEYDFRTENVHVDGLDEAVDVDISFVRRTDKISYPTERAVADLMGNLEGEQREQAIQNVIAAKKLLKHFECYKPYHAGGEDENGKPKAQGGMGGIGVETWILQNGGSLSAAARSFLDKAGVLDDPGAEPKPFKQFVREYQLWDLGSNHTSEATGDYPHDNFIQKNMNEQGYKRTIAALRAYLAAA